MYKSRIILRAESYLLRADSYVLRADFFWILLLVHKILLLYMKIPNVTFHYDFIALHFFNLMAFL